MNSPREATSKFFVTGDGVRLHYLDVDDHERGDRPVVVMLPGWTQPATGFGRQLKSLSESNRCLALDYRGHGESERPSHGYRVSRMARDCLDLLDHLHLDTAVLLGHSAGCTIIWSFIDLFGQDRIRGIVLCDEMIACLRRPEWSAAECARYGVMVDAEEMFNMAARLSGPEGARMLTDFLTKEFPPGFPDVEIDEVIHGSLKVPGEAAAAMMISVMQADYRDVLPGIERPTLCIGGRQSHLGPEVMPWIASQIPGARITLLDTRHFVHLEDPDGFNSAVTRFLAELS